MSEQKNDSTQSFAVLAVKAPPEALPLFKGAQEAVDRVFAKESRDFTAGSNTVGGERYLYLRADILVEYQRRLRDRISEGIASSDLVDELVYEMTFDFGRSVGAADAKAFHKVIGADTPVAKIAPGPILFAYTGWALLEFLPGTVATPDQDYYALYDYENSVEVDLWFKYNKKFSSRPVCSCACGYGVGWVEESFSIQVSAREILCRAKGDPFCRLIKAPTEKLDGYIRKYRAEHPELFQETVSS